MSETPTLTYDIDSLRGDVTEFICSAYSKLKSASETISSLPTPEGCENARNLSEIVDNIKNSAGAVKTAIENAADALEHNEYNLLDLIWDKFKEFFNLPPDIDIDEDKLKDPLSEDNPFKSSKEDVAKSLATKYHIDTRGKTTEQIIAEAKAMERIKRAREWGGEYLEALAEAYGVPTTRTKVTVEEKYGFDNVDTYRYNQLEYQAKLGVTGICGPTSLCEIGSAALGYEYTPEDLFRDFPYATRYYIKGSGYSDAIMKDEAILDRLNLKYESTYYGEAFGRENPEDGKLMKDFEDGKVAIWCTKNQNFTKTGHYMAVSPTEDSKICITDPMGPNYQSQNPVLVEGFANGFDPKRIASYGGHYYVFSQKDPILTSTTTIEKEDDDTIANNIVKRALKEAQGDSAN